MGTLGERLQQARLQAGRSLAEISSRTKIRVALLEHIERDAFDRLPSGLLRRGMLRAYASEVGLDPEAVVQQYLQEYEHGGEEQARRASAADTVAPAAAWVNSLWSGVVPVIVVGIAYIALLAWPDRTPSELGVAAEPTATVGVASVEAAEPVATSSSGTTANTSVPAPDAMPVSSARPDTLTLTISPSGPLWIEATADGRPVLYELLNADAERTIVARDQLTLLVGDAGTFRYSINGVPGRPLGAPGQVRSLRLTRDNYVAFLGGQ